MSDVANATPVSQTQGTPAPTGPSSSPVNAGASASATNQAKIAAEGIQAASPTDPTGEQTPASPAPPPQATPESVSLSAEVVAFAPTGNEAIDQVAKFLAGSGLSEVDGILQEISGDGVLSLENKAKILKELGPDLADLVISNLERAVTDVKVAGEAEGARLKEYALQLFGGSDPNAVWEGAKRFAMSPQSGLSPTDKTMMNEMLAAGGPKAEMVVRDLAYRYQRYEGYQNEGSLVQGDTGAAPLFQPVTRGAYQAEISELVKKYGESSREVQTLRQRRAQSIAKGF